MIQHKNINKHIINLAAAFSKDGYSIKKIVNQFDKVGIMAESNTATNYDTGNKKKVYYLEGTNYVMGYLFGLLSEKEISSMAIDFADKIVFEFIGTDIFDRIKILRELLISIVYEIAKGMYPDLPKAIREEIQGICDGCKKSNPDTKVDIKRLVALNMGVDILCALVYTGYYLLTRNYSLKPSDFKIPIMCNAFSIFGNPAGGGHYFCRDFMFPTADIFQNVATIVIYNPDTTGNEKVFPFVSVTAPGLVGSISAMNINGVGIGVDMSPAVNCNPKRIGTNSLLLARMCAQFGVNADEAVDIVKETLRGVSWNYIISDGANDKACILEAGASNSKLDFNKILPKYLKNLIPESIFLDSSRSAEPINGMMVRWSNYKYPVDYLNYNYTLWEFYNKKHTLEKKLYSNAFSDNGFINRHHTENNCPSTFYFAPQRENNDNLVITTNHYVIPEMRIFAMHPWTASVVGNKINDIQWRYDKLNNLILASLEDRGYIDYNSAKKIIDFLAPYGNHPDYYSKNPKSRDGREIRIEGCTCIFDLKNKIVECHFGYYSDEWIKITLPNYLDQHIITG